MINVFLVSINLLSYKKSQETLKATLISEVEPGAIVYNCNLKNTV